MVPLVPPVVEYMLYIVCGSLSVIGVGAVVFLPRLRPLALCVEFVRTDWKYIGIAWLVSAIVTKLAYRFHVPQTFTGVIYEVEGSAVAVFQTIASPALTMFFAAVYLAVFPAVVLFTYFKLKSHTEIESRRYTLAYVVVVLLSLPFFILTPVGIPGLYPPTTVEPLMFQLTPVITKGMLATDTMVKAFPSLHTGLAVLAILYARKASVRYAVTVGILGSLVVISTFYLGIHWISDAAFAIVLVGIAYWVSRRVDPDQVLPFPTFARFRSKSPSSSQSEESLTDD